MLTVEDADKMVDETYDRLSDKEKEVFKIIAKYIDTFPEGYFEKATIEDMNAHFGGHDDMVVTEAVAEALDCFQVFSILVNEEFDALIEAGEEDDEEE